MAASFLRSLFDRSSARRKKVPRSKESPFSLRSSRRLGGLAAAESLESRAMLAVVATEVVGPTGGVDIELAYSGAANEAIVEVSEFQYSVVDTTTAGIEETQVELGARISVIDVLSQTSYFFEIPLRDPATGVVRPLSITTSGATGDDSLTLQTSQAGATFQLVGIGDTTAGKATGSWQGQLSTVVALNLVDLDEVAVRSDTAVSVSGDFSNNPAVDPFVLDVTAPVINAGIDGVDGLTATDISLRGAQINVGTLGIDATDSLVLTSSAGLTVASVAGSIAAKNSLSVAAFNDISIGPGIDLSSTGGTVNIVSSAGALSLGGSIKADDAISLQAKLGTSVVGAITSTAGNVTVVDLADVVLGGAIEATAGVVSVTSQTGLIEVVGGVTSELGIDLTAGTTVDLLGLETTGDTTGPITIVAGGATTLVGGIKTKNSDLTISSTGNLSVGSAIDIGDGAVTLTGVDVALAVPAKVTAAKVTVEATGGATLGGTVTATGAVEVEAAGSVSLAGVQAADTLSLTSQAGSVASSGGIIVTDAAAITAATTATVNGDFEAGSAEITAIDAVFVGGAMKATAGDIEVTSVEASTTVLGGIDSTAGKVTVASNTVTTINGDINAQLLVSINGIQSVVVAGSVVAAADNIVLTSLAGSVRVDGALETKNATDAVQVKAATDASIGGAITTNDGAVTLEAASGSLSLSGKITAGTATGIVTALSGGDFTSTVGATVDAEEIRITSGGVASLGGALTAQSGVAVKAEGNLGVSGDVVTDTGTVSLASIGGGVSIAGDVESTNDAVTIESRGSTVDITGSIVADDLVSVNAVAAISIAGAIDSNVGEVRLKSATGSIASGTVTASGNQVTLAATDTAAGSITVGDVTSKGIVLRAGLDATIGGIDTKTKGGGDVDLEVVTGSMLVTGDVLTDNDDDVSLVAGQDITLQTTSGITSGTITTVAGGVTTIDGALVANNLLAAQIVITSTGDVSITGNVSAGVVASGAVKISSQSGSLTAVGAITAVGGAVEAKSGDATKITGDITGASITVEAVGDLEVIGVTKSDTTSVAISSTSGNVRTAGVTAATTLDVVATSGDLTVGGLTSSGLMTVEAAAGNAVFSGPLDSNNFLITISAGSAATFNATASIDAGTENVVITASGDVTAFAGAGVTANAVSLTGAVVDFGATITATDAVAVVGSGNVRLGQAVTATKAIQVTGAADVSVNKLVSTSDSVTVAADGAATFSGPVAALMGNATVTAANVVSQAASTFSADGVSITGTDTLLANGSVTAVGGGIDIAGTNDTKVNGDLTTTGGGSVAVSGRAGPLFVSGEIDSAGTLAVDGADAVTITGSLNAIGNVQIKAVAALAVNGDITTAADVAVVGSDAVAVNGSVTAIDITVTGIKATAINGGLTAGAAVTLVSSEDSLSVTGAVAAATELNASANTSLDFGGVVSAAGVAATAGGGLTAVGITSAGEVLLTGGTVAGDVSIAGDVQVTKAGAALEIKSATGSVAVVGSITMTAGGVTVLANGADASVSVVAIQGAGDISLTGSKITTTGVEGLVGEEISLTGDVIQIGGLITGTSVAATGASSVDVNGVITATAAGGDLGGVSITAAGIDGTVTVNKTVDAQGGSLISLLAVKSVTALGLLQTEKTGRVDVIVAAAQDSQGSLSVLSVETEDGEINLQSGSNEFSGAVGSISVLGGIKSTTGSFNALSVGADEGISLNAVNVGGQVSVIAGGGIAIVGGTKGSGVELVAGTTTDVDGSVTTTGGLLKILGGSGINITGALASIADLTATSGGLVSLEAAVSAGGAVTFVANSMTLVDDVTAATGLSLSASEGVAVAGDLKTTTGQITVTSGTSKNGGNVAVLGTVTNIGGDVEITAGIDATTGAVGSVSLVGKVAAGGSATVISKGPDQGVSVVSITASENVSLGADGTIAATGIQATTGRVVVDASGAVSLSQGGLISGATGVSVTSSAGMKVGTQLRSATGTIRVSGNAGTEITADITATLGTIALNSGASLTIVPLPNSIDAPKISAGNELFLSAVGSITVVGDLVSGTSTGGISKTLITSGVGLGTGTLISLTRDIRTNGGSLQVQAGSAQQNPDPTVTQLPNEISISGNIETAGGNIRIEAGDITDEDRISISSEVKAGVGSVTAAADVLNLSAIGRIEGGNISLSGTKTASIDGDVLGSGDIVITGGVTGLSVNGAVASTGGDIALTSAEGAVAINKALSAAGAVELLGFTTVTVSNTLTAGGDISLLATTGEIDVNNAITSTGGKVEVRSAESAVNVEDSITAAGLLEVAAHADAVVGAVAPLTSTGGSIVVGSTTGTITINESVSAGLNVRIAAPQAVVLSGASPVTATAGKIDISSSGSTVTLNDSLTAETSIEVSANGSIATSPGTSLTTSSGDITLSSATGKIEFLAPVNAGDDFTAGALLEVDTKTAAPVTAGGNVSVSSANSTVTLQSSVNATAGTITLAALGAIEATNTARLSAGDGIEIRSNADTVTLAAKLVSGTTPAGKGNIDIDAQLAIITTPGADIVAGGTLSVFSQGQSVTLGDKVTVDDAIDIKAGTFVFHQSGVEVLSNAGSVTLTANAGAVTLLGSSPITAETTIKIDANGADGTFTSGINSPLRSKNADVLINSTNAMLLGVTSGITAGDEIILEASGAGGSITTSINADLEAGGGITLRSDASFIKIGAEAEIKSTGGAVGIFTNGAAGAVTVADSSAVQAAGDIEIVSNSNGITLSSALISDAVVRVRALGGGLATTTDLAIVQAATKIELQASKAILLNGQVATTNTESGSVELNAVTGVTASGNAPIVTGDLRVFNGTAGGGAAGDISLTSPFNALGDVTAGSFSAVNNAAGGSVTFVHSRDLETGLVSTSNGDIEITQVAAGNILITDRIAAGTADIAITSQGQLSDSGLGQVSAVNFIAQNRGGVGDILLDSIFNDVTNAAIRNFATGQQIVYVDATDLTINVGGAGFRTDLGNITVQVGARLSLDAEVYADQGAQLLPVITGTTVSLTAVTGIEQTSAQVVGNNVVLVNGTGPINLPSTTNDTQQLAALNLGGAITYVDVSDFETGVVRTQNPPGGQPVGYEIITPGVLTLQAGAGGGTAAPSTLRVVSGLQYGSLFLRSGDSGTGDVGTVEYVTTSDADNTAPGPAGGFSGTLRDMITYSNENRARQTINGVARVQPQLAVFDEQWYPVRDIVLDTGLPVVVQPLSIDGTRVENTVVDFARVGIDGSEIPVGRTVHGLEYGRGSSDSVITGLALYGFKTGAGISLGSGVNTITNTYAGLTRDGEVYIAGENNLVGIQLDGRLSTKNTVGTIEADDLQANTIGGNAFAGIVLRGGASSNTIVGNYVGTNANEDFLGNNGDGIRIDRSNTNFIGTQTAQRPNLQAALSNVIRFNAGSGIRITESQAPARALGNAIENNFIDGNDQHGIHIVSSARQTVGGDMPNEGNVIGTSGQHGIYMQSTKASQIIANRIGLDQDFVAIGNIGSGIRLQASTDNVINGGNQIGNNVGAGIELLEESDGNRVEGNFVGITIDENTDLSPAANFGAGVFIQQSLRNQVVADNLIANNRGSGVAIIDAEARNVRDGNVIAGNEITQNGLANEGTAGILVQGGGYHTIGGEEGGNTISLNSGDGIRVEKGSLTGDSVSNVITGNFVGTNKFQEDLLGNTGFGILVSYGGSNVIAANSVFSNGVDPNVADALGFDGIRVAGSSSNTIGSTALGEGNIVVGNGGTGIVVTDTVDTNGYGLVSLSATGVARFTRSQLGAVTVGDRIVVNGFEYRITRLVNATTFSVAAVGAAPLPQPQQTFRIRATVSNTGNVVYGNEVEFNAGNGIEVSGGNTNLVTVGEIGIPGRAAGGAANAITGNWGYGVLVTATDGVTIEGNTIAGNGWIDDDGNVMGGGIKLADGANAGAVTPAMLSASVTQRSPGAYTVTAKGTVAAEGVGTVSAAGGTATFGTAQPALAVNDVIVVGTKGYRVTAKASNTTVTLEGSPTFAVGGFRVLTANQIQQQYTIDLYLNQPWQGNSDTGEDFQAAIFLGRTSVLVSDGSTGEFTATFNYMASDTPLGMFVTATSTTTRPATGVVRYSTSELSGVAVMVSLPPSGPAGGTGSVLDRARALAFDSSLSESTTGTGSTGSTSETSAAARRNAFGLLGR